MISNHFTRKKLTRTSRQTSNCEVKKLTIEFKRIDPVLEEVKTNSIIRILREGLKK